MQNAKVFVIIIPQHSTSTTGDEGKSALGLFKKYSGRQVGQINQAVELLACPERGKPAQTVNQELKADKQKAIQLADGDKVGIYLVGHKQSYDTNKPAKLIVSLLEERIKAAPKVEEKVGQKTKMRPIKVTLDKVCLVLCDSAERLTKKGTTKSAADPIVVKGVDEKKANFKTRFDADVKAFGKETSLLAELCRRLAEDGYYPRLAGYTGAITAVGPWEIDDKTWLSKNGFFPQSLKVGQKTPGFDTSGKKLYYVYDAAKGYVQQDLASWTDKR
jgi:hypothetical protein